MHKITKHVMPAEEAITPTPCADEPERWFPDEQKPYPDAVASCWESCYFQRGCARRALAEPQPEHGVWGGYRLAPGPGLEHTRRQLAIVAGYEMGPSLPPSVEVTAVLLDLAALRAAAEAPEADTAPDRSAAPYAKDADAGAIVDPYLSGSEPDDFGTAQPTELDTDIYGQTLLPITGPDSSAPGRGRQPALASRCARPARIATATDEHLQIQLDLVGAGTGTAGTSRRAG